MLLIFFFTERLTFYALSLSLSRLLITQSYNRVRLYIQGQVLRNVLVEYIYNYIELPDRLRSIRYRCTYAIKGGTCV